MHEGMLVVRAFGLVLAAGAGVVLAHVMWLAWMRKRGADIGLLGSGGALAVLIMAGLFVLWDGLGSAAPLIVRIGAACLYLAGAIIYMELRSLLSRGYSLRILVDLWHRRGTARVEQLVASYSDGLGLEGLLRRRVASLAIWRLAQVAGDQVGPLTPLGMACAWLGIGIRRLLRLEIVG